jgi:hypothetical protein
MLPQAAQVSGFRYLLQASEELDPSWIPGLVDKVAPQLDEDEVEALVERALGRPDMFTLLAVSRVVAAPRRWDLVLAALAATPIGRSKDSVHIDHLTSVCAAALEAPRGGPHAGLGRGTRPARRRTRCGCSRARDPSARDRLDRARGCPWRRRAEPRNGARLVAIEVLVLGTEEVRRLLDRACVGVVLPASIASNCSNEERVPSATSRIFSGLRR